MKILVANDKGGVGKSTVAQYCAVRLRGLGPAPRIADFDRQPKLGRFFGADAVTSLGIGPSLADQLRQGDAAAGFWDPLHGWLEDARPLVVDFGAQAWDAFADWAEYSGLATLSAGTVVQCLVPVTADVEALTGALRVLSRVSTVLPAARVALLACGKDGRIEDIAGLPPVRELRSEAGRRGAAWIDLPVLQRDEYAPLAAAGFSFERIAAATSAEIAEATGMSPTAAARSVRGVALWLQAMDASLGAFLGLPRVPAGQALPRPAPPPLATEVPPIELAPARPTSHAATSPTPPTSPAGPRPTVLRSRPRPVTRLAPPPAAPAPVPPRFTAGAPPVAEAIPAGEFDETFYLSRYPDVAAAVRRGAFASGHDHYDKHGSQEGRLARRTP